MTCKAKSLCLIKTKLATNKLSNDILCNMIVVILWLVCVSVGKKSFLATSIQHTNLQTEKQWVNGNTFGSKKSLWYRERFTLTLGLPANHCFPGALWTLRPKKIAALFLPAIKHLKWKTAQSLMWLLVPFYYQLYTIIFYLCGCQISTVMQWINLPSKFNPFTDTWGKCTFKFFKQVLWIDGMIVQVPKTI